MADRTPDVTAQQCLIDFFDDPEGFTWHHRLLLLKGTEQKWIWATPTLEVQLGDLSLHRVIPLRRNSPYPEQYVAEIFGFDEVDREVFQTLMADARALAAILGFATGAEPLGGADR